MSDIKKGLYNKYHILHRESGAEVDGACFVLRPDKDAAARSAMLRYAEATGNLELMADIWNWITGIDPLSECPEEEYPLLDGGTVILAPGDRVLFLRSRPGAMPLTIDPDSVMDDVLQAYKATMLQLGQVSRERDEARNAIAQHIEAFDKIADEFCDESNPRAERINKIIFPFLSLSEGEHE